MHDLPDPADSCAAAQCMVSAWVVSPCRDMGVTARTKHFEMCIHYFRDLVQDKKITAEHILTVFQRADGFTEGLDKTKYFDWVKLLFFFLLLSTVCSRRHVVQIRSYV